MRILALDVGNTTVGAALFEARSGRIQDSGRFETDPSVAEDPLGAWVATADAAHAVLGSVGLGLVVTRKIIEEHRGSIQVESEKGKGTTFTVHLPATIEGAPAASLADTLGAIELESAE